MSTSTTSRFSSIEWLAMVLVTIGALNWGLVGLAEFVGGNLNVVDLVFGSMPALEAAIYLLVGLAGLAMVAVATRRYRHRADEPEIGASGTAR
ncbi:DUF378 domain-containing protein [Halovivax limisalsi]|uniref:DUF378 domain-containing protein n=1 Tax=Halovivax limisalsi TaxID=1453760 RepID=UPI001FFCAD83|nr:DUF378 domain-containing protein [Halovivax limisalsi]